MSTLDHFCNIVQDESEVSITMTLAKFMTSTVMVKSAIDECLQQNIDVNKVRIELGYQEYPANDFKFCRIVMADDNHEDETVIHIYENEVRILLTYEMFTKIWLQMAYRNLNDLQKGKFLTLIKIIIDTETEYISVKTVQVARYEI